MTFMRFSIPKFIYSYISSAQKIQIAVHNANLAISVPNPTPEILEKFRVSLLDVQNIITGINLETFDHSSYFSSLHRMRLYSAVYCLPYNLCCFINENPIFCAAVVATFILMKYRDNGYIDKRTLLKKELGVEDMHISVHDRKLLTLLISASN